MRHNESTLLKLSSKDDDCSKRDITLKAKRNKKHILVEKRRREKGKGKRRNSGLTGTRHQQTEKA